MQARIQSTFQQQLQVPNLMLGKGGLDKPADKPSPNAMEKSL